MRSPIEKIIYGFLAPLKGTLMLLTSPKKFALAVIPFIFGFALLVGGIVWATQSLGTYVDDWLTQFEAISGFLFTTLSSLLIVFSWIGFITVAFLFAYILISIFVGPFYSLLAEDVFRTEAESPSKSLSFRLVLMMMVLSLIKASFFCFIALFCFIFSFIPVLNIVSTYILFLIIAFDTMDYAFEIDYLSLRQRFGFFFKHFWEFSGLALAILATTVLPGAFFVLLPGFVCGSSKMYIELAGK